MAGVEKKCAQCEKTYRVKPSREDKSRFCSLLCKRITESIEKSGSRMPEGCLRKKSGDHTRLSPGKICGHLTKKGRHYCASCRMEMYSNIETKPCLTCGKDMRLSHSQARKYKCCSMECRNVQISVRQSGEKSHLWRGGKTSENMKQRNSSRSQAWRRYVMERDDYTCQMCGSRGGRLCADHIKAWSLYPALRFDVDNGRTLCLGCHAKTPNFGYRAYRQILDAEIEGTLQYRLI